MFPSSRPAQIEFDYHTEYCAYDLAHKRYIPLIGYAVEGEFVISLESGTLRRGHSPAVTHSDSAQLDLLALERLAPRLLPSSSHFPIM